MRRAVFEMDRHRLKDIGAKFVPCLRFGEDAMAEGARAIAALFGVANFEDQLHSDRIAEASEDRGGRSESAPVGLR